MLTLLIAIISESFNKVISLEQQVETYEKLQISYDLRNHGLINNETFQKKYQKTYLYSIKSDESQTENSEIKRIRFKLDYLEKSTKKMKKKFGLLINKMELRENEIPNIKKEGSD
jgi:hypothetical protein